MDVTPSRAELTTRGRAAALRLAAVVRTLAPAEAERPVPGLGWTAIETAAHVVTLYGRGLGDQRRSATAAETAALNATCLAEYGERGAPAVADRIAADAATVWDDVLPLLPDGLEVPFHAGARSTAGPIMGVLLMEMLVHGDDIARATGRPWAVADDDAWCALAAIAPILPAWRRGDVPADDTVAVGGPGPDALRVTCTPDGATVTVAPPAPGDRLVAEAPAPALLGLLGRRPSSGPLADLATRFGPS